ncbi:MAG: polysaccharide deacetylase [Pseudomonadota bacterium]|nr:polysaccharide deacetylase [Pseudomonadota bacterium]
MAKHLLIDQAGAALLWRLIELEKAPWRKAGRRPLLWWRDDDARRPSHGLDRLLRLSRSHDVPLALAVIPDVDLTALGNAIAQFPLVRAMQHGCDHVDRNASGGFSAEFNPAFGEAEIAAAVNAAWRRLSAATDALPVYAPPWNVLTPNVRRALRSTSIRAVSLYGATSAVEDGLSEINTHLDIMRWRPPRFRGTLACLARLWRQLRARRLGARWNEPIGILTHHRNLDEAAWSFLEAFLERTTGPASMFDWRSAQELIGQGKGPTG